MIDEVVRKIYEEDAKVKPHVGLSIQVFHTGSFRPRDRKLARYKSKIHILCLIRRVIVFLVE